MRLTQRLARAAGRGLPAAWLVLGLLTVGVAGGAALCWGDAELAWHGVVGGLLAAFYAWDVARLVRR